MKIREDILEPGYFYHIFNRGNNSKIVFLNNENMAFFLRKTAKYLLPYFDVYAYCLMPNHFHFILRAKSILPESEIIFDKAHGLHSEESLYSKALSRLISSYTQAFNKVYQRSGSLFESPFKRIRIDSEDYLRNLIIYIHQNPENFRNYKFSSYRTIVSNSQTAIHREEVLALFEDRSNFIFCHQNPVDNSQFNI